MVNPNICFLGKKSAGLAIFWVIVFLCLMACSSKDDVAAIRALIKKGAELAEDHDVGGIMDLTTRDVRAHPGQLNRLEIKRVIWRAFRYYGRLKVLYPRPSVDVSENGHQADCKVYLLIVKQDQALPEVKEFYDDPKRWLETVGENADLYQLNLALIKKEGTWQVHQAHLEGFKGFGFSD